MARAVLAFLAIVMLSFGVAASTKVGDSSRPHPLAPRARSEAGPAPETVAATSTAVAVQQLDRYLYAQAVQKEQLLDYLASIPPPAPISVSAPQMSGPADGSVGDCSGFPVPDYIIQRESGGDPTAENPEAVPIGNGQYTHAYGCTQTLLSHYAPGGICAGDDPYTVDGQRACTQTLVDDGGLSPWAE